MNKYLIFRTDRLGDFLLSCILIKSIKRNDPYAHITVLASNKNFDYIKTFDYVDEVVLLKSGFFNRIKTLLDLRKQSYLMTIVHDGKERSTIINFFLKKNITYKFDNKLTSITHFDKILLFLKKINFDFRKDDLDILNTKFEINSKSDLKKRFLVFHYDEKWSNLNYIQHYKNIEPNLNELVFFLNNIQKITNLDVVITTGFIKPTIFKDIKKFLNNNKITILLEQNFLELEKVIMNSKLLISCHGSVSHVAAAMNIKQIDIIDKSYNYKNWTKHFRNYNYLYRKNFKDLSNDIYKLLNNSI